VAYVTTEFGPRPQIAVRDASGTAAPARITRADADHLFPRISPDGRLVAYAANPDGNYDIFIARLDAPGAVRQITFEPGDDVAPAWSPDGKSLVYSARGTSGAWGLVVADVAGRTRTYLGPGMYPDWSPDAKDPWICFQSAPSAPDGWSGLWRIRPDGTHLREVVAGGPGRGSAVHPRFSPDGRWIAYATTVRRFDAAAVGAPEEADDLWAVRADGAFETRLTEDRARDAWPAWAGGRLFFVSDRGGGKDLWSFRVKPLEEEP
jgi:Tol biopolymer transport system component